MKGGNAHFNQAHFTQKVNRSFIRAPGHAPCSDGSVAILNGFECRICGFRNMSKFHFNSHMNTHVIHQCRMCNYTARTAGQIQKHEKTSHTFEQHRAIGIEKFLLAEKVKITSSLKSIAPKTQTHRKRHTGAPKFYACKHKQCGHVSGTKEEKWNHARTHIPKQKQLTCTMCPFVTDLKHHLRYHITSHTQIKAFKCLECEYLCATKSMLASHTKSHTSAYPYRCQDCAYRTKYSHSFKMHLALYNHRLLPQQPQPVPENTNSSAVEFTPGCFAGSNSMLTQILSLQHHNLLQIALNLFRTRLDQLRIGKHTGG